MQDAIFEWEWEEKERRDLTKKKAKSAFCGTKMQEHKWQMAELMDVPSEWYEI